MLRPRLIRAARVGIFSGLALGISGILSPAGAATPVFYSNSAAFNSELATSFTETFASLPADSTVVSPTNFSGNGFSFSALTTSNNASSDPPSSLYSTANRWLTLLWTDDAIVLTNFSADIRAVGGNFFGTDQNGTPESAPISFFASFLDSTTFSTNVTASGSDSFYGLTFDSQLLSLSIGADPSYATIDNLTVGTVVPEPTTLSLLILATAATALVVRRKRNPDA